ncbi:iron chelate uptake ABC transporter family permease subunit [Arthrobacter sp. I2-34]|uniref:Iron chelate uptake ABC transporter family permease subunit n=1 Tax=Arthrobacter hankyongi TaxID=2904801 RepID=A0ABS9L9I2_9MICC|nr:iron chelate uptake ABC transporter family permease subunit [Arthrobacter hankyongi]MCG2623256.1 iron chelate uptake ABC transporter family permease subunit [Arthrobacter hankyongi]
MIAAVGGRPVAAVPDRRLAAGVALAVAGLAAVVLGSLAFGARAVGWDTLVEAFTAFDPANGDHAVLHARIPRTVTGLLAGAALGLAGAAMQGVARNPLADPGILGVNAGASLAVVAGIYAFGITQLSGYIWLAFLGAAAAAVVVYGIASLGREGATPVKLALAGAALTAGLGSVMNAVLVGSRDTLEAFRIWQVGSISGRGWEAVGQVLPFLLAGVLVTACTGKVLNNLSLGDDTARGLGQRVALSRAVSALGIVILCGSATALAGPIAFVGLVIPHMVRAFTGPDYRRILPLSALLAPMLLLGADIVGRLIALPGEVQAGIMTAAVGAPVFIWLVRSRKAAGL